MYTTLRPFEVHAHLENITIIISITSKFLPTLLLIITIITNFVIRILNRTVLNMQYNIKFLNVKPVFHLLRFYSKANYNYSLS